MPQSRFGIFSLVDVERYIDDIKERVSMYMEIAKLYGALYSFKDYRKESGVVITMIKDEHPEARTILDLA